MKIFSRILAALLCTLTVASAALPPVVRNAWSTNPPLATILATNNVWLFPSAYNTLPLVVTDNSGQRAFLVNSNGNIGIGEVNPLFALEISDHNGQVRMNGTNSASWLIGHMGAPANSRYIALESRDSRGLLSSMNDIGTYNQEGIITWNNTNGTVWMIGTVSGSAATNITNFVTLGQLISSNYGVAGTYVLMLNGVASNLLVSPSVYNTSSFTAENNAGSDSFEVSSNGFAVFRDGVTGTNSINNTIYGTAAGVGSNGTNSTSIGQLAGNGNPNNQNSVFLGYTAGYLGSDQYSSVIIGANAGRTAYAMYEAVAIGGWSAYLSQSRRESVSVGFYSDYQRSNSLRSVSVGWRAGYQGAGSYATWVGGEAGQYGYGNSDMTAVGFQAGSSVSAGVGATFVGLSAGQSSQYSSNAVGVGWQSLYTAAGNWGTVAVGSYAGYSAINTPYSTFVGLNAGENAYHTDQMVGVGYKSSWFASRQTNSVNVGTYSGYQGTNNSRSVAIGYSASYQSLNSSNVVAVGENAGFRQTNSPNSVSVGAGAGSQASTALQSVFIGRSTGNNTRSVSNSVLIGAYAGTNSTRANVLMIDSTGKDTNCLIYGEFDNGLVRVNTNFQVGAKANAPYAPAAVNQPIGMFGFLNLFTQVSSAVMSLTFYTNIISFNNVTTNGFLANPATGVLTNTVAGYYRISIDLTARGASNQHIEGCVLTNNVDGELIGFQKQFSNTQVRKAAQSATGIIYLPALTQVSFGIKSTNDITAIVISKANLTIGTP